jgi:tetratricopeptide (TPR) repeat protein
LKPVAVPILVCLSVVAANNNLSGVDGMMELGHWKRARQIAMERVKANPNDAQAHAWLAKASTAFGDLETSVREAERAVELDRNQAGFHEQLAESCALMADKSHILKSLPYVHRMKKEIEAALSIDANHVDTLLLEMVFDWKAPALAGGDKQQARRIADRILTINATWGYLAQARLLQLKGDEAAAEPVLKKAVQADPSFHRARISLAVYYCGEHTCRAPAEAERAALEAIALDPTAGGAYEILARVYVVQKRWADLDQLLNRSAAAVPDDLGPYFAAASRLVDIGEDFDRAERYLRRYLSQPPEGREPTHAEARMVLANLYQRAGRKADAFRELELAVQLQPDLEPARRDLNRLRRN